MPDDLYAETSRLLNKRGLSFPNYPMIPTKPAVFDDRELVSHYMAKCKRRRTDGPTPCYCCPGRCVGEPRSAAEDAAYRLACEERLSAPVPSSACPWAWPMTWLAVVFIVAAGIFH